MQNSNLAWQPSENFIEGTRIKKFMNFLNIQSCEELIERSREDIDWFWENALKNLGIEWFVPYQQLYDNSMGMPWTKWFLGGKLNIVHNCIDRHIRDGKGSHIAIKFESDDGKVSYITYTDLAKSVDAAAAELLESGISKGDVIGLCMTLCPESVIAMLATLKIGAISMHIATRLSSQEMIKLLNQGRARALFIDNGYIRAGNTFGLDQAIYSILHSTSLKTIVIRNRLNIEKKEKNTRYLYWDVFCSKNGSAQTEKLNAEDPALILFSSGTTGKAKAAVHTHGGALAQITKEIGYAFDCKENDTFYWFTNIGWMMAPWEIIGTLFFGATLMLYEGTHLFPTPHRMFELIEQHSITIFGFIPTAIRSLAKLNEDFMTHDLASIRILGSTGEPLDPCAWNWYFDIFGKKRCPLINITGGTELIGCLISPLPITGLKAGTVGYPGLGMDIDVWNENGTTLRNGPGILVCKKPFPSMTKGLLNDPERYIESYFSKWPNIWVHGDRAEIDKDGFWYLLGRSDDLIIRGGIKYDPAKIEEVLISFPRVPSVKEAAVIGIRDPERYERIVCFIVIDNDMQYAFNKEQYINELRRHTLSIYDRSAYIDEVYIVESLPKNLAAKIPRSYIRHAYSDEAMENFPTIDNPESIKKIREIVWDTKRRPV
jgi:acetyl-CoA synthetase